MTTVAAVRMRRALAVWLTAAAVLVLPTVLPAAGVPQTPDAGERLLSGGSPSSAPDVAGVRESQGEPDRLAREDASGGPGAADHSRAAAPIRPGDAAGITDQPSRAAAAAERDAVGDGSDSGTAPVALPPIAAAIADCESEGSYTAENPVSSASGAYQFIASTWEWVTGLEPPASAHPPEVQDQAFLELWAGGAGASHWNASRHCWEVH